MTLNNIYALMDKFDSSSAAKMELTMEDVTLKLEKPSSVNELYDSTVEAKTIMKKTEKSYNNQAFAMGSTDSARLKIESEDNTTSDESNVKYVKAPLVGVFYEASSPDSEPFVKVGSRIKEGDTVCLIEAMKMMSEVSATATGTIKEILVKNGDTVEYDTPLYIIQE